VSDTHECIVGLPKAWTPFYDARADLFLELPVQWPVLCILSVIGKTIHDVVNTRETQTTVYQFFKAWKEVQRRNAGKEQVAWNAWLAWCRHLGCPV